MVVDTRAPSKAETAVLGVGRSAQSTGESFPTDLPGVTGDVWKTKSGIREDVIAWSQARFFVLAVIASKTGDAVTEVRSLANLESAFLRTQFNVEVRSTESGTRNDGALKDSVTTKESSAYTAGRIAGVALIVIIAVGVTAFLVSRSRRAARRRQMTPIGSVELNQTSPWPAPETPPRPPSPPPPAPSRD